MEQTSMKADLHVHSKYSKRPSQWILQKLGCPESFTEPHMLYKTAKNKGMDIVTITDHNTLAGSLEIAHLDDTFISEEITSYFPEDKCKVHILAHNITESEHEDISRLRENIYDLVRYLNEKSIFYAVAHAMYSPNDRLTVEHFEELLVLFNTFELNGTRDGFQNRILQEILNSLEKEDIERFADGYDLQPFGQTPWLKNLIGGSDDHSSLNIAGTHTCVEGAGSIEDFFNGIGNNRARVHFAESSPKKLGQNIYSIAYQFYKTKLRLDRYVNKDLLLRFIERSLTVSHGNEEYLVGRLRNFVDNRLTNQFFKSAPKTIQDMLQNEARKIILGSETMSSLLKGDTNIGGSDSEESWFQFVDQVSEKVLKQFADSFLERISRANLFDIFQTVGSAGSLYTIVAPYFVAYSVFTKDRNFCRQCSKRFRKKGSDDTSETLKIGHFTDTFYEVNGVALTLKKQISIARKNNKSLNIITCGPKSVTPGVTNFPPVGTFELPEYPDLKLFYPPLLKMIDYCYRENITMIHSATPGPIGLAALAIARILKLPISGTYHTALPQYVNNLTGDTGLEDMCWKYVIWYYNQMDEVFVPSQATGRELVERGIHKEKIRHYPRGIDTEIFHPSYRNGFFKSKFHIGDEKLKLIYVGRVSKEKNLDLLVHSFRQLCRTRSDLHLIIVGEGPYLDEMKRIMRDLPVTFSGLLMGKDLAEAYASSDIFVFPSTTDTFGNVVLEAQASGIPAIVTDQGGPRENVIPGKTGFIVPAADKEGFTRAVTRLLDDPDLLESMKQNAREYTEDRSFEAAYLKQWDMYHCSLKAVA